MHSNANKRADQNDFIQRASDRHHMSIETLEALVLGWLLGLLGPAIVEAIRRRYLEKEVRLAILTELRDLQLRMVTAAYMFEIRYGTYDRALLLWAIDVMENYGGPTHAAKLLASLKEQVNFNDAVIAALASKQRAEQGKGLAVKKYRLPYLDSTIGDLGLFDEKSRSAILDIRIQLDLFNEEVDESRMYHKMTFDSSASTTNHAVVRQNADNAYRNLGQKAKHIVDRIGPLLRRN